VQALEEARVRAVERTQVRTHGDAQIQRVAGGRRRRAVEREVEGLETQLGIGAKRQSEAVG
jgi:hypothetical protein